MIASKVLKEKELHQVLANFGYEKSEKTNTGCFWHNHEHEAKMPRTLHIPDSVQGFYPDWLLSEIQGIDKQIEKAVNEKRENQLNKR